jgi:hypothetical protein
LGRWLTNDLIGFNAGDVNLIAFESSNPNNMLDPSGLFDIPCLPCIFGKGSIVFDGEDYWKYIRSKYRRKGFTYDQINQMEEQYNRGCVGLTSLEIGLSNPKTWPETRFCYNSLQSAEKKANEMIKTKYCEKKGGCNENGEKSTPVIFGLRFYPLGIPYNPTGEDGRIDMGPWRRKAPGQEKIPFDYGYWDPFFKVFVHADHDMPGMKVSWSSYEQFRDKFPAFGDKGGVYCVTCKNWGFGSPDIKKP